MARSAKPAHGPSVIESPGVPGRAAPRSGAEIKRRGNEIMSVTEDHLHHIAKRHDSLSRRYENLKSKGAKLTSRLVRSGEVMLGAAAGGVLQGMSKNPQGPHIAHFPADLAIGLGLEAVATFDLFGEEWSK